MAKPVVSQRHRPTIKAYFRENWRTTTGRAEEAHLMAALGWLFLSALVGTITGLAVPVVWEQRLALGLAVFLAIQFGLITPIRMWRNAIWVQNVEKNLDGLWDLQDKGTNLLNEDAYYKNNNPNWEHETETTQHWVEGWIGRVDTWDANTAKALGAFSPLDARRFKNLVTFDRSRISGLTDMHTFRKNILATKLEKLGDMLEKHHPSQLPE